MIPRFSNKRLTRECAMPVGGPQWPLPIEPGRGAHAPARSSQAPSPFSGASQRGRLWPMSATDPADHRSAPTSNTRRRLAQTAPVPSRRTMLLLSTIAAGALAGCSIWKRDIGGTVLKSDQARTELTLE